MSCLTTKGMHTIGAVCTSPNLFLLTDLSLLKTTMAAFESVLSTSCRILEMTEVNVEFHESLIFFREVIFIMALYSQGRASQRNIGCTKSLYPNKGKKAKGIISSCRYSFDVMPEDKIDHMETENAQSEGRTREMVDEDKEFDEDRLSIEDEVSTDKEGVSTDFEKVRTDKPIVSTDESKVSTDDQVEDEELSIPEQTATGKGTSNPLMAGSLPKTTKPT
ncbi:hypothetical protein Tco_1018027 [Tanacetum coccineum]|uniref:Uncharacterized protein n=1 Tax=Tanacetum coccineum TaxID=301880 RepID=A0ABQ5FVR6_9ASTR